MSAGWVQPGVPGHDPAATELRARFNTERGSFDLGDWLHERTQVQPGARLLDVGSGTGSLLSRYAANALRTGRCVALDASADSLRVLQEAARAAGYSGLEAVCSDMDMLAVPGAYPELRDFTHIVSAYALYYSADATRLLEALCTRLHPEGRLFVAAPTPGNNREWFELLAEAGVRIPAAIRDVSFFLERTVLPFALRRFESVRVDNACNTVRFESLEEVVAYWRSNIYYVPGATRALRAAARHLGGAPFTNHKRIGLVTMHGKLEG